MTYTLVLPHKKRKWTSDELITLIGMAELKYSIAEMAENLNRSKHSVQSRLVRYAFEKTFGDLKWEASNDYSSPLGLTE